MYNKYLSIVYFAWQSGGIEFYPFKNLNGSKALKHLTSSNQESLILPVILASV